MPPCEAAPRHGRAKRQGGRSQEDRMPLDRPGRHDHAPRVDEVKPLLAVHRDERPLVDAGDGGPLEHRHAVRAQLVGDRRLERALVGKDHPLARLRGRVRRDDPCAAAAGNKHVGVVVASLAVSGWEIAGCRPDPGDPSNRRLGEPPGEAGSQERLVVETDGEQAAQAPEQRERIPVYRGPPVLAVDRLTVDRSGHARPHAGLPVNGDEAVRAVARQAVEAAWPVVLEGAREDAHSRPVHRRRHRVVGLDRDRPTLEDKSSFQNEALSRRGSVILR